MYFFLSLGNFAKHLSIPSTFSKLVWSWIYLFWWSIWGVPFLYQGMWLLLIDMKRILKVRTGNAILVHVYIHIVSPLNQMVLQYTITMEPMGTFPSHLRLRWTAKYTIPQSHLLLIKALFSQFLVVKLNPIFTSCIRLPFFIPVWIWPDQKEVQKSSDRMREKSVAGLSRWFFEIHTTHWVFLNFDGISEVRRDLRRYGYSFSQPHDRCAVFLIEFACEIPSGMSQT